MRVGNRFEDADAIWNGGASNPRAVARALVNAIDEACDVRGGEGAKDSAVKMILDHLCFLCGLPQPSFSIEPADWYAIVGDVEQAAAKFKDFKLEK